MQYIHNIYKYVYKGYMNCNVNKYIRKINGYNIR